MEYYIVLHGSGIQSSVFQIWVPNHVSWSYLVLNWYQWREFVGSGQPQLWATPVEKREYLFAGMSITYEVFWLFLKFIQKYYGEKISLKSWWPKYFWNTVGKLMKKVTKWDQNHLHISIRSVFTVILVIGLEEPITFHDLWNVLTWAKYHVICRIFTPIYKCWFMSIPVVLSKINRGCSKSNPRGFNT